MKRLRVTVPATIDGLGPGAGILGLALALTDTVDVELDEGSTVISGDPAICAAYQSWPADRYVGARFTREPGIPEGYGLGEDTARIVAGLATAVAATEAKEARKELFRLALQQGARPTQLAACVMGGLITTLPEAGGLAAIHVADHLLMDVVLFLPDEPLSLPDRRAEPALLAYLLTALVWGRWDWIGPVMTPGRVPTPVREVLNVAREAGAYGSSVSGSVLYALTPHGQGEDVMKAMDGSARRIGLGGTALTTTVREPGVEVKVLQASEG